MTDVDGSDPRANVTLATVVSPSGGGVTSGDGTFPPGTSVTARATEGLNYRFVNWTYSNGSEASRQAVFTFNITANTTLTAHFSYHEIIEPIKVLVGPTIKAGTSLSDALVVSSGGLHRIIMPKAWTGAVISFQVSYDNIEFYNVYDRGGKEVTLRCIPLSAVPFTEPLHYVYAMKIRSGSSEEPIVQDADRVFKIVVGSDVVTGYSYTR